jgi:pimeloyl-ACP methyl ester carboxylesterase
MSQPVFYRTIKVDGLSIFYREAGSKDAPTLLLLHGLPSSSRMFEPDPRTFAYTFDRYAEIVNHFSEALGLSHYNLYM